MQRRTLVATLATTGVAPGCLRLTETGQDSTGERRAASDQGGDAQPTSTTTSTSSENVTRRWGHDGAVRTGLSVADGTVYVGGLLQDRALSVETGDTQWSKTIPYGGSTTRISGPTPAGGRVYYGDQAEGGHVYVRSAGDGSIQWEFRYDGWESGGFTEPVVAGDTVYAVNLNFDEVGSALVALSAEDGTERWRFTTDGRLRPPAVADGAVYLGSRDGTVYSLSAADGTERWRSDTPSQVVGPPAVADGTVHLASTGLRPLRALSAADGSFQWAFREADTGASSAPVVADGTIYFGTRGGTVYALRTGPETAVDEREAWNVETDTAVSTLSTVAGGRVYVGDEDGTVYALSAASGTEQWRFGTTGGGTVRSIEAASGTVYVGTGDSSSDTGVYALTAE